MALRPRQLRFYKYTFSVYRQVAQTGASEDVVYSSTPVYTGVPALFESTPEADEPTAVGRNKQVNILTMDKGHFPLSYDFGSGEVAIVIEDTDFVTMTAGPNNTPDVGAWWAVQGGTQAHATTIANKQVLYIKKAEKPAGIP